MCELVQFFILLVVTVGGVIMFIAGGIRLMKPFTEDTTSSPTDSEYKNPDAGRDFIRLWMKSSLKGKKETLEIYFNYLGAVIEIKANVSDEILEQPEIRAEILRVAKLKYPGLYLDGARIKPLRY